MGGAPLQRMRLSSGMFGASAMRMEGVRLHLTALKVKQLRVLVVELVSLAARTRFIPILEDGFPLDINANQGFRLEFR